jgi:molybdate transport system ATP-binding protein
MIDVDIEQRLGDFHLDVSFSAEAPIVGLFGRSGSGKTSIVNAIAGIARPERGSIRINDAVLFDADRRVDLPPESRRVGYVFQEGLLFPHLDVHANLTYGQRLRDAGDRFIDEARVVELLGLQGLLQRKPRSLSGGEKQRVAIGRALLAQPRILLLDEPLASLDSARKTEILDYIERLRDELAIPIVYVSHSVAEMTRLADTVVVLSEGKCIAIGAVDEVIGRLVHEPELEHDDAGSVLDTHVTAHDSAEGLTTLAFDGGDLLVPRLDAAIGDRGRATIRARDVSLALHRPADVSILNILAATVISTDEPSVAHVDVRLAVGGSTVIARITGRSSRQLGIRPGLELHAMIKAVSFDRRSVGYA